MSDTPVPTRLTVHQQSRCLEVAFASGECFFLPFELLRVFSPSAEVQGHGPGQDVLQTGKREVSIESVEPVGHYAIQPTFSDGHGSGIFTWAYLHQLGSFQDEFWAEYESRLRAAGLDRDTPMPARSSGSSGGCSH